MAAAGVMGCLELNRFGNVDEPIVISGARNSHVVMPASRDVLNHVGSISFHSF